VKTILAALSFLVATGCACAQAVEHPLRVHFPRLPNDAEETQRVKTAVLIGVSNNPHYTIVETNWDIQVKFSCMTIKAVNEDGQTASITGYSCGSENEYVDEWGIEYSFGILVLSGSESQVARNILSSFVEDTTPDSIQKAREYTESIVAAIKAKTLTEAK